MCLIEDQSWIDCIDITSRWDTFVLFHLYGNKGVSLPLWPIRPRWFHTFSPCAEPLGDGHEGMGARFGSQGSIALNWHSRYSGTRYSGTWLYLCCTHRPTVHCSSLKLTEVMKSFLKFRVSGFEISNCSWWTLISMEYIPAKTLSPQVVQRDHAEITLSCGLAHWEI